MIETVVSQPPISKTIIDAVADAEGVDPIELRPHLYDAIDIDALNALIPAPQTTAQTDLHVTFTYHEYVITVRGNGTITVEDQSE